MPPPRTAIIPPQPNPNVQQVIFGGQKGLANINAAAQPPTAPEDTPPWMTSVAGTVTSARQMPQIGPSGQMADAQNMENKGADPQTIFQQTGWYHAPDGQWKWVLSDKNASLNMDRFVPGTPDPDTGKPTVTLRYSSNQTLPDVLNHPDLYTTYPKLATAQVKKLPADRDNGSLIADYDANTNTVELSSNQEPQSLTSVLLHELQHGVQSTEGFALGGNKEQFYPSYFYDEAMPALKAWNTVKSQVEAAGVEPWGLRDALTKQVNGDTSYNTFIKAQTAKLSPQVANQFTDAVYGLNHITDMEDDAYQQYRNLAGETEARQVQQQYELKNWNNPPTILPGFVPANEQILNFPSSRASYTNTPTGTQYDESAPSTTVAPPSDTTPPTALQSVAPPQYDSNTWTTAEPGGAF